MKADRTKIILWGMTILMIVAGLWFVSYKYLTFEQIKIIGKNTAETARSNPTMVFLLLASAHCIGMVLSLPTKGLLTILSGALIGTYLGIFATLTGVLVGTTALFYATRCMLRERIASKFSGKIKKIESKISARPIRAMIGLRLMITLPYGPCTVAAALSSMSYGQFLLGTLLGDIPVVVLYSAAGQKLSALASENEILSPSTIAIFVIVGLIFVVGAAAGKN